MSMKIDSNLISLQQIYSSLNSNQNIISEKTLVKTISNLRKLLNELENNVKPGFTPLTEILRPEVLAVLRNLDQTIEAYSNKIELKKIQEVKDKIFNVQAAVKAAPLQEKKNDIPIDSIRPLAFFCDLETPDGNKANIWMMQQAIEQGIPFITTSSLIRGTGFRGILGKSCSVDINIGKFFIEIEKSLLQKQENVEIFRKGEMLVFMPHSYLPEKNSEEKLASFDLKTDGSLQPISMHEALQGPQEKADIDAFMDLFVFEPKEHKLFYLFGHGFTNIVGGLGAEKYQKFLNFLEDQHCIGLAITSCFSGGESSLLNIPDEVKAANFFDQTKPRSFPTLVRSMGDFPSVSQKEDIKAFLHEFASFAGNSGGQTAAELRRRIEMLDVREGEKEICNLIQYYPPHGAGSPAAFRALGEGGKGFAITYVLAKSTEITSQKPFNKNGAAQEIIVEDAELLEVYPLVTPVPVRFSNKNPVLLSKAPGKGHHFIKGINCSFDTEFLKSTIEFYKKNRLEDDVQYNQAAVDKAFFIGAINGIEMKFKNIVLYLSPEATALNFVTNENSFFTTKDAESFVQLDPLSYAIFNFELALATRSEDKAIRAMSAGQETEADFQDAIIDAGFFPDPFFLLFNITNNSIECTPNFMELIKTRTQKEKQDAIVFLLKQGHIDITFKLYDQESINSNIEDFFGNSLIDIAIKADAIKVVELALSGSLKEKINTVNIDGYSPLYLAINQLKKAYDKKEKGVPGADKNVELREKIVDLLLSQSNIKLEAKKEKYPIILAALPNRSLVNKLINMGANPTPCLNRCLNEQDYQSLDLLLEFKADPNSIRALDMAIYYNDLILVEKLIKAGAKIDTDALNAAIFRASPKIVRFLIENKNTPLEEGFSGMTPMLAALVSGSDEKIKIVKSKFTTLPDEFDESLITGIFDRFLLCNDRKNFEGLLQLNCFNLTCGLIKYLLNKDLSFLKELISNDKIDVREEGECAIGYKRHTSVLQFILDNSKDQELIELISQ